MTVYAYYMTDDNGFAPNPFGGICSLACCKPKIRRSVADALSSSCTNAIKAECQSKRWDSRCKNMLRKISGCDELTIAAMRTISKHADIKWTITDADIWVAGLVSSKLSEKYGLTRNRVIYLMQVTNIVTMVEYSSDTYCYKRPIQDRPYSEFTEHTDYRICGDSIYDFDTNNGCIKQLSSFHYKPGEIFCPDTVVHDISGVYVLLSSEFCYFGKNDTAPVVTPLSNQRGHTVLHGEDTEQYKDIIASSHGVLGRPIESGNDFFPYH